MKKQRVSCVATEHEELYLAAPRCPAIALRLLSLTSACLRGLKNPSPVASRNTGRGFASHSECREVLNSGCPLFVSPLSTFKGLGLILPFVTPQGEDDARPNNGQRSHSNCMAFAFHPFALILSQRPRFTQGPLPGKLLHGIAQGFDTSIPPVRFGVGATLKDGQRSARQGLQTGSVRIATLNHRQSLPTVEEPGAFPHEAGCGNGNCQRGSKKPLNLLIIVGDLFNQRVQLLEQDQHQPRFGACRDGIGTQVGLMELLEDLHRGLSRVGCFACLRVSVSCSSEAS
jgi:hypothetical protein